jgi:hypothetical protein
MRTRVRTAIAALTVVVGVAACSSGNDDAARSDTGLGAGAAGGTSAGTISPAGTAGAAGSSAGAAGATSTTGATVGPTTGTTGAMTHADSLRADSVRRGTSTTPRP